MNRLRVIFVAATGVIALGGVLWMHHPGSALSPVSAPPAYGTTGFQVTAISERGNLFLSNGETRPLGIRAPAFLVEARLHSDEQTAWEFLFDGFLFTALPGSAVRFTPQTRDLILERGEFYWERKQEGRRIEISLFKGGNIFKLSAAGRIRLGADLEIWNYSEPIDFDLNGTLYRVEERQYWSSRDGGKQLTVSLLPAPPFVSPETLTLALAQPNDTIVQFKWKSVQGAREYVFKLYPSALRDHLLLSRAVDENAVTLDIMPFIEYPLLHWEVAALDPVRRIEMVPARMGVIRISSSLLKKGLMPQPPMIEVSSLSVSGEMVLIKGATDPHARLYIDGTPVKMDSAGKFIHTISFRSIGIKEIVFRAVAPSGLESLLKKQVTIFEE
ncbi:MAG: hypothetical protein JXO51_05655 [Candidatus Aminicenantes bacterium]|nr:hypothetical protein [Candidatus Aminicenantes bacterium]